MKSFETWLFDEVEIAFSLKRVKKHILLTDWLSSKKNISEYEKKSIELQCEQLSNNVDAWNEDELKLQFIGPFLWFVNYITDKYKPFTQRSLSIKTDSVESSGLVDFMIATGKSRPKEPFFFLHEYKQQHPSKKNDPLGQLLIAMVAAQEKNGNNHPIYGVIVEGRYWYFVVLHNKEYVVSPSYDATKEEIFQIYAILCKVKDYIELILSENKYPLS